MANIALNIVKNILPNPGADLGVLDQGFKLAEVGSMCTV